MPIKLDLKAGKENVKTAPQTQQAVDLPDKKASNKTSVKQPPKKSAVSAKRGQGRPKGDPVVTRSLRIKEDINERLVKEQELTGLSYNELANRAFDAYLR